MDQCIIDEPSYEDRLLSDLFRRRSTDELFVTSIRCAGGKVIKCHRVVMAKACRKIPLKPVTSGSEEAVEKFVEMCYGLRKMISVYDVPEFLKIAEDLKLRDPIRMNLIEAFSKQKYFLTRPHLARMVPQSILKLTDDTGPEWAQFLFQWWDKQPQRRAVYLDLMKKSKLKSSYSALSISTMSLSKFYR